MSRDGLWVYFSSTNRDIGGGLNDPYRISPNGGTPMMVSADRYTNEFFCAPAPGKTLAFSARGIASGQWWRKGRSHIDESEIWLLRSFDGAGTYERVTAPGGAKELWPMWSADGRSLFYVSDRAGAGNRNSAQNIWTITYRAKPSTIFCLKQLELDRQVLLRVLAEVVDHFDAFRR
jgi:tricorn protease